LRRARLGARARRLSEEFDDSGIVPLDAPRQAFHQRRARTPRHFSYGRVRASEPRLELTAGLDGAALLGEVA